MKLPIIYPQRRTVDADTAIGWAHDSMIDDAIAEYQKTHGQQTFDGDDGEAIFDGIRASVDRPTLLDAIRYLEDAGTVTFTRDAHAAAKAAVCL